MLEEWKDGMLKPTFRSSPEIVLSNCIIPLFQYSIIPVFHRSLPPAMKPALFLTTAVLTALTLFARAEDKVVSVGGNAFKAVAPWTEGTPTGMFDKAALNFPIEGGTALIAKFSEFPGGGGGVEPNVKRWIGQFEGGAPETKREDLKFGDVEVVLLSLTGTFLDGPPMSSNKTPRPDFTMLGGIIMKGDIATFVKLTGPKADVAKAAEAFKTLVTSPFPAK